ncbi:MAG TPA: hypothetical protein VF062_03380, partial [Candidatus Limnocylindrales bacterium]
MQAHISMALRLAGVLAAVPLWAGCEAATDAAPEESASPPGANASRTEGVALRGAPEPGTCHRVPPQVPADADYW